MTAKEYYLKQDYIEVWADEKEDLYKMLNDFAEIKINERLSLTENIIFTTVKIDENYHNLLQINLRTLTSKETNKLELIGMLRENLNQILIENNLKVESKIYKL